MISRRDGYKDNAATAHYPDFGEPPGLTRRQARAWRRANTWYITRGEKIAPEVVADPPDCFTAKEWETWLPTLPIAGFQMRNSPSVVQGERPDERLARQQRATRAAACSDCMFKRQLEAERAGVCHPPKYAITPRDCRQPIQGAEGCPDHGWACMASDRLALEREGIDVAAPREGSGRPDVFLEEGVSDREAR